MSATESTALVRVREPLPAITGAAGVAQGSYGDIGNLELVVPDVIDGFWVFWFNADDVEHCRGAARGCWSGGLHVATGGPLDRVSIAQVPFGPDYLEVVAEAGASRLRFYWTPSEGFVRGGDLPGGPSTNGTFAWQSSLLVLGETVHRATAADYPVAHWQDWPGAPRLTEFGSASLGVRGEQVAVVGVRPDRSAVLRRSDRAGEWDPKSLPGSWRALVIAGTHGAGWILAGLDASGAPAVLRVDGANSCLLPLNVGLPGSPQSLAATVSSLDGGTVEIVLRIGAGLHHIRVPLDGIASEEHRPLRATPIVSDVWSTLPRPATIHRR